jgi:lipopolysaccharide transport system ATP-binding protein
MRKTEITRKLDEIIAFAGVEKYVDTPVKRYSSGMYVRLAFAVAAHLENEILIIDEVLAVGDAEFQKKCLGKMEDVSKGQGRTVLFVSHNLTAVKSLCNKSIVLENGLLKFSGSVNQSINEYNYNLNSLEYLFVFDKTNKYSNEKFEIRKVSVLNKHGNLQTIIDESTEVIIETSCLILDDLNSYHLSFVFKNSENQILFTTHNSRSPLSIGDNLVTFTIPANFLNVDIYYISFYLIQNKQHSMLFEEDFMKLNVLQSPKSYGDWMGKEPGFIKTNFDWKMNNSNL